MNVHNSIISQNILLHTAYIKSSSTHFKPQCIKYFPRHGNFNNFATKYTFYSNIPCLLFSVIMSCCLRILKIILLFYFEIISVIPL